MIIECQTCHARFRLEESRIKGRGARVKCRKCGDSIIVLKDSPPVPPETGGAGFFDLGSAVRESAGESPDSPPPVGNLIPFPAPFRPTEPAAPDAAGPGKDDVDLAFDRALTAGAEPSSPSIGETGVSAEREVPAGTASRPELDFGALTLDFGPEEKLDLPPAVEPPAEFRGEGGFLISDSDTLDFLQEKPREAAPEAPRGVGDISLEISSVPVDQEHLLPEESAAPPTPREEWASPIRGEISLEGNVTPPAIPVIEVPPHREEEPSPVPAVESSAHRESPGPESPGPRSSAVPAVVAVLTVLLVAGGYLFLTTSGRKMLERAIPGVAALWGGKPTAPAAPKYDLRNVIGYYESGSASPRILVIKGQVANISTVEKSGIRVHAGLLDNADAVLAQQTVYAGNILSGEAIRKGDRDTLLKALENRFGEGLMNMHVAPGKAIPFMVVFFDAPANMDSYKLEAKDSE